MPEDNLDKRPIKSVNSKDSSIVLSTLLYWHCVSRNKNGYYLSREQYELWRNELVAFCHIKEVDKKDDEEKDPKYPRLIPVNIPMCGQGAITNCLKYLDGDEKASTPTLEVIKLVFLMVHKQYSQSIPHGVNMPKSLQEEMREVILVDGKKRLKMLLIWNALLKPHNKKMIVLTDPMMIEFAFFFFEKLSQYQEVILLLPSPWTDTEIVRNARKLRVEKSRLETNYIKLYENTKKLMFMFNSSNCTSELKIRYSSDIGLDLSRVGGFVNPFTPSIASSKSLVSYSSESLIFKVCHSWGINSEEYGETGILRGLSDKSIDFMDHPILQQSSEKPRLKLPEIQL